MTKKQTPTPTPTEDPDATADLLDRAKALKEKAQVEGWSDNYRMSRIHSMNRARGDLNDALRRVDRATAAVPAARALAAQLDDLRNALVRLPNPFLTDWRIVIAGSRNDPRDSVSRVSLGASEVARGMLDGIEAVRPNVEAMEAAVEAARARIPSLTTRLAEAYAEAERARLAVASPAA